MGLGKTLQIFALIENSYKKIIESGEKIRPSLIIVPTTLTEHWCFEYNKYFKSPYCISQIVSGREPKLVVPSKIKKNTPIIYVTSYQVVEKKTELFLNH